MAAETDLQLTALAVMVHNLIRPAEVKEVDLDAARVRLLLAGGIVTGWRPWLTAMAGENRSWRPPEIGERVLLLSPSGNVENCFVLPGFNCTDFPAPDSSGDKAVLHFKDGARVVYDHASHTLDVALPDGGTVNVIASAGVTVNANGGVTIEAADGGVAITGDVMVDGKITATDDISDPKGSMEEMRTKYNAHSGHGAGGPPSPQMD